MQKPGVEHVLWLLLANREITFCRAINGIAYDRRTIRPLIGLWERDQRARLAA